MRKTSYSALKQTAKHKMKGHFGEAFLALAVLPFVFGLIQQAIITAMGDQVILSFVISFFITVLIQYIGIMLVLKIFKGNFHDLFINLLGNKQGYTNMLIYTLVTTAIMTLPLFIFMDSMADIQAYLLSLPAEYIPAPGEMEDKIMSYLPSTQLMYTSLLLLITSIIVGVKLFFTPYLIVDKSMSAIDAMKQSWKYSNGNFFRIFFFPFSFILWFLLIFVTCGLILIYLLPYLSLSMAALYDAVLKENDDYVEPVKKEVASETVDHLGEEKKPKDAFEEYYE